MTSLAWHSRLSVGGRWILAAVGLYVLGLHVLIYVLLTGTDFLPGFKARYLDRKAIYNPHGQRMLAFHRYMDGSVPDGAAIFLGDSITQGLATSAVALGSVNFGIGSATTFELLDNMRWYRSLQRASAIFLNIGINDIGRGATDGLGKRLQAIANALPADRPLIWSGIMPVYTGTIDPLDIEEANRSIRKLCAVRSQCWYVDTAKVLGSGGEAFFLDGLHPNDLGYSRWIEALRPAYQRAMAPKDPG